MGAAANVYKELAVGLVSHTFTDNKGQPIYFKGDAEINGGFGGIGIHDQQFDGEIKAAAFRGGFWAIIAGQGVTDVPKMLDGLGGKYGSLVSLPEGKAKTIQDAIYLSGLNGAEILAASGAYGALKWIPVSVQFPVFTGIYKSLGETLRDGKRPNGTLLNLETPVEIPDSKKSFKTTTLARMFDDNGVLEPSAQAIIKKDVIAAPATGVMLSPTLDGVTIASEKGLLPKEVSEGIGKTLDELPLRGSMGLARVAGTVTLADYIIEKMSMNTIEVPEDKNRKVGDSSNSNKFRVQMWRDKNNGNVFASYEGMDMSKASENHLKGAEPLEIQNADITTREQLAGGMEEGERGGGGWASLLFLNKPTAGAEAERSNITTETTPGRIIKVDTFSFGSGTDGIDPEVGITLHSINRLTYADRRPEQVLVSADGKSTTRVYKVNSSEIPEGFTGGMGTRATYEDGTRETIILQDGTEGAKDHELSESGKLEQMALHDTSLQPVAKRVSKWMMPY